MGVCERIKNEVSITDYARYMGFTILKKGSVFVNTSNPHNISTSIFTLTL